MKTLLKFFPFMPAPKETGKLMALKPDVTLSIVKNSRDCAGVQKLYYHENVYRVSKGNQGYREIIRLLLGGAMCRPFAFLTLLACLLRTTFR